MASKIIARHCEPRGGEAISADGMEIVTPNLPANAAYFIISKQAGKNRRLRNDSFSGDRSINKDL